MTDEYLKELIIKYAQGNASQEEIAALTNWYRSSNIGEVSWQSSSNDEKQLVYNRVLSRLRKDIHPSKMAVRRIQWLRAAAVLLLVVGAATLIYLLNPPSPTFVTVTNPGGKIQKLMLPDSSEVWLNAATTIRYDKDFVNHRYVQLEGEAYFDVAHDGAHPFTISAGEIKNTVLGTRFNIEAYESSSSVIVSLISGKLRVEHDSKELAVLSPMQQISFARASGDANLQNIDTTAILSWMSGTLDFQGQSLADIALELERWFNVDIELSPSISSCRYYLSFDNDVPLEQVLQSMTELSKIKYTVRDRSVTITGETCN